MPRSVGERSRNSKFSYVSPRSIYGETSNEGKEGEEKKKERGAGEGVLDKGVSGQPDYILWPDCWTMKIQD